MEMFYGLAFWLLLLSRQCSICSTQAIVLTGKITVQSSTYVSGAVSYAAGLSVDGDFTTNFDSGSCSRTQPEVNPWWYVDLGGTYSISYVILYATQGLEGSLVGTEVRIGNVGFAPFSDNVQCGSTITSENLNNNPFAIICNSPLDGHFVTLYQSDNNYMEFNVCEVQVYGVVSLDNENPSVTCPGAVIVSTTTRLATVTWYNPVVNDNVDTHLSATCAPSSGSLFYVGETYVTCSATDTDGNIGSCTFRVIVIDYMSPSVTCPGEIQVYNTASSLTTVTWNNPVVNDNVDTDLSATCTPSSGSSFNAASNVICAATDAAGNVGQCAFRVNFAVSEGNEYPSVTCPGDIDMSTSSNQVTVTWIDPVVTDNANTGLSATCTPSSGSSFNVGETYVTCSATDAAGNIGSCTFKVNVIGPDGYQSPILNCPDDINQATVVWSDPVVSDNIDTGLSATCTPSSGSSFNAGSTDVTCSTVDTDGNKAVCSFIVNIMGSCNASSVPVLIAVVVILCVFILGMSPAFAFFCRFYYSQRNKRMEPSTGMDMTDNENVGIPNTTTNAPGHTEYEISLPTIGNDDAAEPPPNLESQRMDSAYDDLHTYMAVDPAYTDLNK